MRITTLQPYFMPYLGFFCKAAAADLVVILDDVQFPRGTTWISRNRFKNDQGLFWMTIPVWKKGLGLQRIQDVRICYEGRWIHKHIMSLKMAYAHAPYRDDHLKVFETALRARYSQLIDLNLDLIRHVMAYLDLKTRIVRQSEIGAVGTGNALLVDICHRVGARQFLAQGAARKYVDAGALRRAGIDLDIVHVPQPVYPQLWGEFVPNLSVWDLLFNCGPQAAPLTITGRFSSPLGHHPS